SSKDGTFGVVDVDTAKPKDDSSEESEGVLKNCEYTKYPPAPKNTTKTTSITSVLVEKLFDFSAIY
ncbi:hypothetical protein KKF61_05590, partial [Patescibacteria group bacterium]|nr:hypothetical protein [Patescibacteria group bacterium]